MNHDDLSKSAHQMRVYGRANRDAIAELLGDGERWYTIAPGIYVALAETDALAPLRPTDPATLASWLLRRGHADGCVLTRDDATDRAIVYLSRPAYQLVRDDYDAL